ncbi:PREDICTED: clathrin light chain B [Dipodomys ordii]|uniref:Clathrin light chain n=1 Tax=Dipodomys ordii TaxID=10020 RepID=A0A1S3F6I0_DIPOR|nr:PREDICTED: clathrin light chain B [Dipodomys ordii]
MADDFGFFSSSDSGVPETAAAAVAAEEDPAAAFLAQQESEIAGIENDDEEAFGAPAAGQVSSAQPGPTGGAGSEEMGTAVNGDVFQEANGPADGYAAIAQADRLTQEPESIRKWREEQKKRLQELVFSLHRASEEAFVKESKEETPGTEWEKVAQLCDFNPKSSKQCKDVSRLRSVLMSLKQTPLSR